MAAISLKWGPNSIQGNLSGGADTEILTICPPQEVITRTQVRVTLYRGTGYKKVKKFLQNIKKIWGWPVILQLLKKQKNNGNVIPHPIY